MTVTRIPSFGSQRSIKHNNTTLHHLSCQLYLAYRAKWVAAHRVVESNSARGILTDDEKILRVCRRIVGLTGKKEWFNTRQRYRGAVGQLVLLERYCIIDVHHKCITRANPSLHSDRSSILSV